MDFSGHGFFTGFPDFFSGIIGILAIISFFMLVPTLIMLVMTIISRDRSASSMQLKMLRFAIFASIGVLIGAVAFECYARYTHDYYYRLLMWPEAIFLVIPSALGFPIQVCLLRMLKEKDEEISQKGQRP